MSAPLLRLPAEIIFMVIVFLSDPNDVVAFMLANKELMAVINTRSTRNWWAVRQPLSRYSFLRSIYPSLVDTRPLEEQRLRPSLDTTCTDRYIKMYTQAPFPDQLQYKLSVILAGLDDVEERMALDRTNQEVKYNRNPIVRLLSGVLAANENIVKMQPHPLTVLRDFICMHPVDSRLWLAFCTRAMYISKALKRSKYAEERRQLVSVIFSSNVLPLNDIKRIFADKKRFLRVSSPTGMPDQCDRLINYRMLSLVVTAERCGNRFLLSALPRKVLLSGWQYFSCCPNAIINYLIVVFDARYLRESREELIKLLGNIRTKFYRTYVHSLHQKYDPAQKDSLAAALKPIVTTSKITDMERMGRLANLPFKNMNCDIHGPYPDYYYSGYYADEQLNLDLCSWIVTYLWPFGFKLRDYAIFEYLSGNNLKKFLSLYVVAPSPFTYARQHMAKTALSVIKNRCLDALPRVIERLGLKPDYFHLNGAIIIYHLIEMGDVDYYKTVRDMFGAKDVFSKLTVTSPFNRTTLKQMGFLDKVSRENDHLVFTFTEKFLKNAILVYICEGKPFTLRVYSPLTPQ